LMKLTIIGCSDAFSTGGRYHSCYLLDTSEGRLMIDCGANAPLALKRAGISLSSIDAIIISHCHGDHFGGLPFLYLEKIFAERSSAPLEILGPPGIEARTTALLECLYPAMTQHPKAFDAVYRELSPGMRSAWRGLTIDAYEADHFSGTPSLALGIAGGGRRFGFSGDSGWCEGVVAAGRDSHLYLIECTYYSTKGAMHLDYLTLATKFSEIGAERYLLTHLGQEMLNAAGLIDPSKCTLAEDGLAVMV
jgi:ribonuclease BN (tRNA processing enzyme)